MSTQWRIFEPLYHPLMEKPGGQTGHHIVQEATLLTRCLEVHFRLTPEKVGELLRLGAVYLNKRRVLEDCELRPGAYLRIHLKPKRFNISGINWASRVVHQDKQFIVVNKPAGIPVHASLDNILENVQEQMRRRLNTPLWVTQRLDVPVFGLLVLARTKEYQAYFNRLLLERKVLKKYRALIEGSIALGHYTHFMMPSERSPKVVSTNENPGWLKCDLEILSCEPSRHSPFHEIHVRLHSGRTHQIRAQLAHLGFPILGDKLYGSKTRYRPHEIALASCEVEWDGGKHRFQLVDLTLDPTGNFPHSE